MNINQKIGRAPGVVRGTDLDRAIDGHGQNPIRYRTDLGVLGCGGGHGQSAETEGKNGQPLAEIGHGEDILRVEYVALDTEAILSH